MMRMTETNKFLKERYEKYEIEERMEELVKENKKLSKENKNLKKKNKHFQSTKAYKIWQKYANLKKKSDSKNNKAKKKGTKKNEGVASSDLNSKAKAETKTKKVKNPKDIRVALISDQFTYDSFKYEFTPISLHPKTWKKEIKKGKPDLFLCESTWDGHNYKGNTGPWRFKVIKYYNQEENRQTLLEIIEYCKEHNIPTVYWNKEDPPNYKTDRWSAADTSKTFDYVFTSAVECIKHYKKDFNHPNVYPLMFAGQPRLFNPLNLSNETIEEVVFAGSYNPRHKERVILMERIMDKIIEEWKNIRIYDRNYFKTWGKFPEKYQQYILPPIPYDETPNLYKKMKWGLNFNTVTCSETMFARRVFELSLTNTLILTNYSKGVERIFGDNVFYFDKTDELPDFNNDYEEKRLNNLYNVLENHTYAKRWREILDTIGFEYEERKEEITVIFKLNELDDLNNVESVIERFNNIDYEDKILRILISSSISDDNASIDIGQIKEKYPEIDKIYIEKDGDYKKNIKKDIKTDYWIIISDALEDDFIKKAILHYQYLNRKVSICKGEEKFKLGLKDNIENMLITKERLDLLDNEDLEIETYSI